MEPPMKHKFSAVPVNASEQEVDLEDKNNSLVKRRRTEFSGSIVEPKQETEVSVMETENKVHDGLPVEVSTGKDPMDSDCAVQSSGKENGCSKGHARGISFTGYTGTEPARFRLPKLCTAIGWKEPAFDFEEQGPPHNKLFICKVTVHLDGLVNTLIECFSDPKPKKKDAQEKSMLLKGHCGALSALDMPSEIFRCAVPSSVSANLSAALANPCFRCHIPNVHVSFNLGQMVYLFFHWLLAVFGGNTSASSSADPSP